MLVWLTLIPLVLSHILLGASASAAVSTGIITNYILEAADWNSESVFQCFHYRLTTSNVVGSAVLSTVPTAMLQT